jgi:hypothetical protein
VRQHHARNRFRAEQSLAQVKDSMPKLFPGAAARQNNIIIRPLGKTGHFVRLDDLDAGGLGRVGEAAFLTLETSPGNHQAWVAVSGIQRLRPQAQERGRGRPFRFGRYPRRRHNQLQTQIRAGFSDRADRCNGPRLYCDEGAAGDNGTGSSSRAGDRDPGFHRQDAARQDRSAFHDARQGMAGLCPLASRSAAQTRRQRPGPEHGGLFMVHDGHRLGMEHRGHRPKAPRSQRKGGRTSLSQILRLSAHYRSTCRRSGREKRAETGQEISFATSRAPPENKCLHVTCLSLRLRADFARR